MTKRVTISDRFPFAGLFIVIALVIAVPLTVWSLNNTPTQTKQQASTSCSSYGGTCTGSSVCQIEGYGTISGGYCSSGVCCSFTPPCPSTQQILNDFGANITGSSTCQMRKAIYDTIGLLYTGQYRTLITAGGTYNIRLTIRNLGDGVCGGILQDKNNLDFYDLSDCASDIRKSNYILSHEITHILARRQATRYNNYPYSTLVSKDPSCYKNGFLKTYSGIYISGVDPKFESFAEEAGLFIVNSKVGPYGTISDFKSQCPNTYSGIKSAIF